MTSPEFTRNSDNFCYRHPDRQSFVLCQRCLRTICPECQTQAAVGVICPECLRDQQKAQTPAQVKARAPVVAEARDGRRSRASARSSRTRSSPPTVLVFVTQLIPNSPVQEWLFFYAPYLYPS